MPAPDTPLSVGPPHTVCGWRRARPPRGKSARAGPCGPERRRHQTAAAAQPHPRVVLLIQVKGAACGAAGWLLEGDPGTSSLTSDTST
jgi:hypothetical protein